MLTFLQSGCLVLSILVLFFFFFFFFQAEDAIRDTSVTGVQTCALPISQEPPVLMSEYAKLTGHPELPPLWAFGYQQSHRTLATHEEVLSEAKTFREKKLPCDTLIYLGTGLCPSGWHTENGSLSWNSRAF